jgi:hypothetical protein
MTSQMHYGFELQTDLRMDRDEEEAYWCIRKNGIWLSKKDQQVKFRYCFCFTGYEATIYLVFWQLNVAPEL